MRKMIYLKRIRNVIIGVAISLFLFLITLFASPMIYNQIKLSSFSSNFFQYPLPPNTIVLEYDEWVGKSGNGNHCSFEASMRIKTEWSEDSLWDYYKDVTFPAVGRGSTAQAIADLDGRVPVFIRYIPESNEVILRIYDGIYTGGFGSYDIRCN